jgi:ADP-ribose pyrophosphatase
VEPGASGDRLDPPVESRRVYDGHIVKLRISRYRRPSGVEVEREVLDHPGAVVICPVEHDHLILVRQPREAVERRLLELPAGKLDVPGESPLECAQRELAEEAGRSAGTWRELGRGFWMSPALLTEFIVPFLATDLAPVPLGHDHEQEEIEIVRWPLADLDGLIERVQDAKSLICLLRLARELG